MALIPDAPRPGPREIAVSVLAPDAGSLAEVNGVLAAGGFTLAENGTRDVVLVVDASETFDARLRLNGMEEELEGTPIVVAASDDRASTVQAALRCGAVGFVPYDRLSETLGPCIRAVAAGQLSVPQERRAEVQKPALTAREKQTLALVVMGMRNCEIAKQLYLAESTVKSHLSSAFAKLGVRSRNEAAALILDPRAGVGTGILTIPSGEPSPRP